MQRVLSKLILLVFVIGVTSCGGRGAGHPADSKELGNFLTTKLEQRIVLTEEQKTKIVALTKAAGIMNEGVRSSEDGEKLKALRNQIMAEVLTDEQKQKLNQ